MEEEDDDDDPPGAVLLLLLLFWTGPGPRPAAVSDDAWRTAFSEVDASC